MMDVVANFAPKLDFENWLLPSNFHGTMVRLTNLKGHVMV